MYWAITCGPRVLRLLVDPVNPSGERHFPRDTQHEYADLASMGRIHVLSDNCVNNKYASSSVWTIYLEPEASAGILMPELT